MEYLYYVYKYYDSKKDIFVVEEQWRANCNSPNLKKREYKFRFLVDFIAFLNGDLTNADLLLCDGLGFITDFSQINFNGALVISSIKEKAGLLNSNEALSISIPDTIESIANTELESLSEECIPHKELSFSEQSNVKKIYYISDLHLPHHINTTDTKTEEDTIYKLRRIVDELTKDIYSTDILLIVGDTSCDLLCFRKFVKMLRESTRAQVVFVLGNHEFWEFENTSLTNILFIYRDILSNEGMYLLQNNIIYSEDVNKPLQVISEEELSVIDQSNLRKKLLCAPIILFGGVGFSGLNQEFNANNGIYKNAITRKKEIEESCKFEELYIKVRNTLADREVIVATHMPLCDWSHDVEHHGGYVYLSGHTHRNKFYDDGIMRIYADNQVGYYGKHVFLKNFYIEGNYDPFIDYCDGVHEINRGDYANFYRGKNIRMDFNRDFDHLYMLKQNGYYCFIIQTSNGKLSILNGGSTKIIKNKTIESCYEKMAEIIHLIKTPLDEYTSIQTQVSNFVKSIGGDGRIHGAIIDIDYFNHIYVNPNDLKVTGYYATDMVNKYVYGSIQGLLSDRRPDLLLDYNKAIVEGHSTSIIVSQNLDSGFDNKIYYSTDMYKYSNLLKKMQRLYSNILTVWPEKVTSTTGGIDEGKGKFYLK